MRIRHTIPLAFAALAALAAPAAASPQPGADTLEAACVARDGRFATGFGYHRCFGAEIDGRGQFTAAEAVCDQARESAFAWARTPDSYYGPDRGSWVCSIN